MATNLSAAEANCAIAGDDIYGKSYADYIQSAYDKLQTLAYNIGNIINTPENPLDSDFTIIYDGRKGVLASALRQALLDEEDEVTDLENNKILIDDLLQKVNDDINNTNVVVKAVNNVNAIQENATDRATLFSTACYNKFMQASGVVKDTIEKYTDLISDEGLSIRDKIDFIRNDVLGSSEPDTTRINNSLSDIEDARVSQYTGTSVGSMIGAAIGDAFSNIDLSNVKTAIVSGAKSLWEATKRGLNWLANNSSHFITKTVDRALEWSNATNEDMKFLSGGDHTIDNAAMSINIPVSDIQSWCSSSIAYFNNRQVNIYHFLINVRRNRWYVFDIPGCRIYIARTSINGVETICMRLKWRLFDNSVLDYAYDSGATLSEVFANISRLEASFEPQIGEEFYTRDSYFLTGIYLAKALAYLYLLHEQDSLDKTMIEAGYNTSTSWALAISLLCGNGSGTLNPVPSGNKYTWKALGYNEDNELALIDYSADDPLNIDLLEAASITGSSTNLNSSSLLYDYTNAAFDNQDFAKILCKYAFLHCAWNFELGNHWGIFTPYVETDHIMKGSYYIRSDSDNVNKVLTRVGGVVAVAGIVALTVAGLSAMKNLKVSAVTANLNASTIQSQMQAKLAAGEKLTSSEKNLLYKATKKAVRLNKLTGGFASITTGLSTWQSSALNLPNGISNANDLRVLITG